MSSSPRLYPTDLSDAEWAILEPLIPSVKPGGRDRKWPMRLIMDGIFYVVRSGCQWRLVPREFPPWQTVYHYFRLFRLDGTWEHLNASLREQERVRLGRTPQPSAAIIDSQYPFRAHSVKATSVGGTRGYDGAKMLSGRKRHVLVDVNGLVLRARVHAADMQDRAGVSLVLDGAHLDFPQIELIRAIPGAARPGSKSTWAGAWRSCSMRRDPVANGPSCQTLMTRPRGTSSGSGSLLPKRSFAASSLGDGSRSARSAGLGRADAWQRSTSD